MAAEAEPFMEDEDSISLERCPLRISKIREEADRILSFELCHPDGLELPPFAAGAHLHVHIDDDLTRQYSLCNDPAETDRYVIAVLNEPDGRGGSQAMHALKKGQYVSVSGPENHFPLAGREATSHLLIAGGIGITPMMAMIEELERAGSTYCLHYCTRGPEQTAFLDRLQPRIEDGHVILHHDGGNPENGLDIAGLLAEYEVGTHVYACGPPGFMSAFNASVGAWPPHAVHQEYFTARELTEEEKAWDEKPFTVRLARSKKTLKVAAGQSIVDVVREAGLEVRTDCEEGYCGTCITRYLEGEPVHRDTVLDDNDRQSYVMICCARSRGKKLVLDL